MMDLFSRQVGNMKFRFPTFKFLSNQHATAMKNAGNIYLPKLRDFRDAAAHAGLILDTGEGKLGIINEYTFYEGLAKNADGLIPVQNPPYEFLAVVGEKRQTVIDGGHLHAYCLTQHILSDSFEWAIGERVKETCVMITDMEKFLEIVVPHVAVEGFEFVAARDCIYALDDDRNVVEKDPGPHSVSNMFLSKEILVPFAKPAKYGVQRTTRDMGFAPRCAKPRV